MKTHLSIGGSRRKIAPSTSSPIAFKVVARGAAMCEALQLRFKVGRAISYSAGFDCLPAGAAVISNRHAR